MSDTTYGVRCITCGDVVQSPSMSEAIYDCAVAGWHHHVVQLVERVSDGKWIIWRGFNDVGDTP